MGLRRVRVSHVLHLNMNQQLFLLFLLLLHMMVMMTWSSFWTAMERLKWNQKFWREMFHGNPKRSSRQMKNFLVRKGSCNTAEFLSENDWRKPPEVQWALVPRVSETCLGPLCCRCNCRWIGMRWVFTASGWWSGWHERFWFSFFGSGGSRTRSVGILSSGNHQDCPGHLLGGSGADREQVRADFEQWQLYRISGSLAWWMRRSCTSRSGLAWWQRCRPSTSLGFAGQRWCISWWSGFWNIAPTCWSWWTLLWGSSAWWRRRLGRGIGPHPDLMGNRGMHQQIQSWFAWVAKHGKSTPVWGLDSSARPCHERSFKFGELLVGLDSATGSSSLSTLETPLQRVQLDPRIPEELSDRRYGRTEQRRVHQFDDTAQASAAVRGADSAVVDRSTRSIRNAWNAFQHQHKDEGLTSTVMSKCTKTRRRSPM